MFIVWMGFEVSWHRSGEIIKMDEKKYLTITRLIDSKIKLNEIEFSEFVTVLIDFVDKKIINNDIIYKDLAVCQYNDIIFSSIKLARDFLNNKATEKNLEERVVSIWPICDRYANGTKQNSIFRLLICCLGIDESSKNDLKIYGYDEALAICLEYMEIINYNLPDDFAEFALSMWHDQKHI